MILTWDEIANLYDKRTGGIARIQSLNNVFDWATNQPDIEVTEDGCLELRSDGDASYEGMEWYDFKR